MTFRNDINGLRAIAVLLVVLFHFAIPGVSGGFVGVDVFFVISGYLMTQIIVSRHQEGRFRLMEFYQARCRRILPALVVLCAVLLVVGLILTLPKDYVSLGTQVMTSLTFVSNLFFWLDTGYFQPSAHDLWLLHTWSLSVEWQFYLLYPLLIVALCRFMPISRGRWVLLAAAVASFAISLVASVHWPTGAFFLLPARAWEMLAGALVFLFPLRFSPLGRQVATWTGCAMIAASAAFATPGMLWPGYFALLPVGGAALIIASAHQGCWLLNNPVAQYLGTTSYSIYLWHWPFAVWLYYFGLDKQPLWVGLGMLASILVGHLSYRFVELSASRREGRIHRSSPLTKYSAVFGIAGVGMVAVVTEGLPERLPRDYRAAIAEIALPIVTNGWCFYSVESIETLPIGSRGHTCQVGDRNGTLDALLIGDSFAGHYGPFWDAVGKRHAMKIHTISTNWCFPSADDDYTGPTTSRGFRQCMVNRDYLEKHVGSYDLVIFAGSWGVIDQQNKLDGVYAAIEETAETTPLLVIMPTPTNFDVNVGDHYARSIRFDLPFDIARYSKQRDVPSREANEKLKTFASAWDNVTFLDRGALFHIDGTPSDVTEENIPFGLDTSGHLSIYGSKKAAEAFFASRAYRRFQDRITDLSRQPRAVALGAGDRSVARPSEG